MIRKTVLSGIWLVAAALVGCSNEAPADVSHTLDPARSTIKLDRNTDVIANGVDAVQIVVTALDEAGNVLPGLDVVLTADGGEAVLSAAPPTDENGVSQATLTSTQPGTVTITASVDGLQLSQKPTVEFVKAMATKLGFTVFPGAVEAGALIAPAIQVAVLDAQGKRMTDADATVSLTLEGGDASGVLLGSTSAETNAGIATFSDLRIETVGTAYVLVASAPGLETAKSPPFDVNTDASASPTLSFATQPVDSKAGAVFASIVVELIDAAGRRAIDENVPVTLSLGGTTGAATLGGTLTVNASEGASTFTDLHVENAAEGYTLVASAPGFSGAESNAFDIEPAAFDENRSSLTTNAGSAVADGLDEIETQVRAVDAFGNVIANLPVTLTSSETSDVFVPTTGVTDAEGLFSAKLTATTPGARTIGANVGDHTLSTQVSFTAGAPSETHTTLVTSSASVVAGRPVTLTVVVLDANEHPIEGQQVAFTSTGDDNRFVDASGVTDETGTFSAVFSSTKAEGKTITADIGPFSKSLPVTVVPGAASDDRTTLTVDKSSVTANGSAFATLTVVVQDSNGNPISNQAVLFRASGERHTFTPSSGKTNAAGQFTATLRSTKAETKTVTATIGLLSKSESLVFVPGPASSPNTKLTVSKNSASAVGGEAITLTVEALDAYANAIAGQAVSLSSTGDANTFTPPSGTTDSSGRFVATLTSTKAQDKTITATVGTVTKNVPVTFVPGPANSEMSTLTASKDPIAADGSDSTTITVVARDASGNTLADENISFDSTGSGNTFSPSSGTTNGVGLITAQFSSTKAETKTLVVGIGSTSKSMQVKFVPGAVDSEKTTFTASKSSASAVGETVVLVVEAKDAGGNAIPNQTVSFASTGQANSISPSTAETDNAGKVIAAFTSTQAEKKTVTATIGSVEKTVSVTFVPGAVNADKSTLSASVFSVVADGTESITLTLTVRDANGNAIADEAVSISSTGSANTFSVQSGNTTSNGIFSTVLTSTKAEEKEITATIGTVVKTVTVLFRPGAPSSAKSTLTASDNPVVANGIDTTTLTLVLRDAYENAITDYQVSLSASGSSNIFSSTFGWTNDAGEFSATLASTLAESKTITATSDGVSLAANVEFVSGPVDSARSSVVASPTTVLDDGTSKVLVSIAARDAHDNPVKNAAVQLNVTGQGNSVEPPVNTDTAGQTSGTFTSTYAEVKTIKVMAGNVWLRDEPKVTVVKATSVGGVVMGLTSRGLELSFNDGEPLSIDQNGNFTFGSRVVAVDGTYNVNVFAQPANQACIVFNGEGVATSEGVKDIQVKCGPTWLKIVSGPDAISNMGIKSDGTLWAWGNNTYGQLGDGSTTNRTHPVKIGNDFVSIAMGGSHSLGVKSDGTLWAWGNNAYGQLGDDSTVNKHTPVMIGAGYASVAAGHSHSLAIMTNGQLMAWGRNHAGQLGDNTRVDRHRPISLGLGHTSVAAGSSHSLAVRGSQLWAWGSNTKGQLGDGTTTERWSPTRIKGETLFESVSAGGSHSMAVSSNGVLFGWGDNTQGQLGDGSTEQRNSPVVVDTGVSSVSAGANHTMGVKNDGTLWTWGSNQYGQLGDGSKTSTNLPVKVETNVASVAGGREHSMALKTDGTLWAWGGYYHGQIGDGSRTDQLTPSLAYTRFIMVSAGANHTMALNTEGMLWGWGGNSHGQIGDGTTTDRTSPVLVGKDFAFVSAGGAYTMAIKTDGSLWGWGNNSDYQLGNGNSTNQQRPVLLGSGYATVSAGMNHTLGLKTDGTLWAWGSNSQGKLGDGSRFDRESPEAIGSGFASVATGKSHSIAQKTDGSSWAWGGNHLYQIGDNTKVDKLVPTRIATNFTSVAAGSDSSFALELNGMLYGWGDNSRGQLGIGNTQDQPTAVRIGSPYVFHSVTSGALHSVALMKSGELWAWGWNVFGQVGDGSTVPQTRPVEIGKGFASASAGDEHTVAAKFDGTLWGWGNNRYGQIGDGSKNNRHSPTPVWTGIE